MGRSPAHAGQNHEADTTCPWWRLTKQRSCSTRFSATAISSILRSAFISFPNDFHWQNHSLINPSRLRPSASTPSFLLSSESPTIITVPDSGFFSVVSKFAPVTRSRYVLSSLAAYAAGFPASGAHYRIVQHVHCPHLIAEERLLVPVPPEPLSRNAMRPSAVKHQEYVKGTLLVQRFPR